MNETHGFSDVATKVLVIIGFVATILLLVWLITLGIKQAPGAFSSLASIAESIDTYRPQAELSITLEKTVVNSGESFQINWTDLKKTGEYHVNYTCTEGVSVMVRGADGTLVPMSCESTLSLPDTVHGIFLSINSGAMRFTDVRMKVSFTHTDGVEVHETETKITVVNATIPTTGSVPVQKENVIKKPAVPPITETKPPAPTTKPVVRNSPYPASDPNGYVDLSVTSLGSGVLTNGIFSYAPTYDRNLRNALRFDVKNIGTKTSGTWSFKTITPSGEVYTSVIQVALNPQEHIEYTIGFPLTDEVSPVKIITTVSVVGDMNPANNQMTATVPVRN